jgi:hypothetical protein
MDGDNITQAHPQIVPDNLVHAHFCLLHCVIPQDNAHRVLPLLPLQMPKTMTPFKLQTNSCPKTELPQSKTPSSLYVCIVEIYLALLTRTTLLVMIQHLVPLQEPLA